MAVEYYYAEGGGYDSVKEELRQAIGQYARHNEYLYIGITCRDPEDRFAEHQRKWEEGQDWDKMRVIYKGDDWAEIKYIETKLINFAEPKLKGRLLSSAKGGRDCTNQPHGYWVYVLLDNKVY